MINYDKFLQPTAKKLEAQIIKDYQGGKKMVQIARDLNVNYHHVRNIIKDPRRS